MKFRDRIITQAVICCALFVAVKGAAMITNESFCKFRDTIQTKAEQNYTIEDVKQMGENAIEKIKGVPTALTNAIIEANQLGEFGVPIDAQPSEQIQNVHATSGGVVIASGFNDKIGYFVKINHQEKISVYGNMYKINVVPGERVKKGDIIGSYDSQGKEEFYYKLLEKEGLDV